MIPDVEEDPILQVSGQKTLNIRQTPNLCIWHPSKLGTLVDVGISSLSRYAIKDDPFLRSQVRNHQNPGLPPGGSTYMINIVLENIFFNF